MEGYELRYNDWKPGENPREMAETFRSHSDAIKRVHDLRLGFYGIWHYRSGYETVCVTLHHAA